MPGIRVGRRVGRPVRLHHEPLLRGGPDESLEGVRELLRHALHIVAQPAAAFDRERRTEPDAVPPLVAEVGRRREERCARSERQHRRPSGHPCPLAEEVDLDAVAAQVAVTHQADHVPAEQCAEHRGARIRAERNDLHADGPAGRDEPLEELGRFDGLRHDRHSHTAPGEPRPRDIPVPEVRERQHDAPSPGDGRIEMLAPAHSEALLELGATARPEPEHLVPVARVVREHRRRGTIECGPLELAARDATEVTHDLLSAAAPCGRHGTRCDTGERETDGRRKAPRRLSAGPVREIGGAGAGHGGSARRGAEAPAGRPARAWPGARPSRTGGRR